MTTVYVNDSADPDMTLVYTDADRDEITQRFISMWIDSQTIYNINEEKEVAQLMECAGLLTWDDDCNPVSDLVDNDGDVWFKSLPANIQHDLVWLQIEPRSPEEIDLTKCTDTPEWMNERQSSYDVYFGAEKAWTDAQQLHSVMTVAEAAEVFSKDVSGIRNAASAGVIPSRQSGATWLILRADAEERWG